MLGKVYNHKHRVYYYETDKMGRVYHSNFLKWMDEARTEFIRNRGLSYKELEDMGIMLPVGELSIKYINAIDYDEEVLIKTTLEKITKVKVEFLYEFYDLNCKKKFASAKTISVFTDLSGKIKRIDNNIFEKLGGE